MVATELAKRGHEVAVCNDCRDGAGNYGGVEYLSGPPADNDDPALVIVQRDWCKVLANRRHFPGATIALYCHDVPHGGHWPEASAEDRARVIAAVDWVVLLNEYHRRKYLAAGCPTEKATIIRIGLDPTDYNAARAANAERDPYRCVYVSHPHRGLHTLRACWERIHAAVPQATLAAFWWEPAHFHDPVPELGILPMRALSPPQVAVELYRASLLTYPSVFWAEISPASTIKAAAAGAVPVVQLQGGMVDTVQFGRIVPQGGDYAGAVIEALRQPLWQEHTRQEMIPWALETFRWSGAAAAFEALVA
jgi:glycosyltransferase involved in cell wall biosynthesis